MTSEQTLAKILSHHLRRVEKNYRGTLRGSDPEHLHDLRVAIRRIRFALRLFAPFVDEKRCTEIRVALGSLNDRSGDVRDLDVSLGRLKKLFAKKRIDPAVKRRILRELTARYRAARTEMLAALTSSRYHESISAVRTFIHDLERAPARGARDNRKAFRALTAEHARELAQWGKWNAKKLSTKDLHKMRIDFKRARYLMEFAIFCGAERRAAKEIVARYKSFQDMLGKHRDSLTLAKTVREIAKEAGLDKRTVEEIVSAETNRARKNVKKFAKLWQPTNGR